MARAQYLGAPTLPNLRPLRVQLCLVCRKLLCTLLHCATAMALSARLPSSTRPHPVRSGRANRVVVYAAGAPQDKGEEGRKESFIEAFFGGNLLDFSSWAPRSSRIWRLNQYDYEASTSVNEAEGERRSERGCVAAGGGASWARQHGRSHAQLTPSRCARRSQLDSSVVVTLRVCALPCIPGP